VAERSFAGFSYQDRVAVGYYGELFRARSSTQGEVRLLHVDSDLAGTTGFAEALARFGTDLSKLSDASIVSTRTMGRALDGTLVVVTEPVEDAVSVADLLDAFGAGLRPEAAIAIARGVLAALAAAHRVGIVHGGLHPRSVLIDARGAVKVTDFAVARAIAACSAGAEGAPLIEAARGYVAAELEGGSEPTMRSDVYAVGALLFALLSGDTPPGKLKTTRSLGRLISRALDVDVGRRFRDAVEMAQALDTLIESGAAPPLPPDQLAAHAREVTAAVENHLDGATDDLLSFIASGNDAGDSSLPAVGDEGEHTSTGDDEPTVVQPEAAPLPPLAPAKKVSTGQLDALLSDLDGDLGTNDGISAGTPITSEPVAEEAVVGEELQDNTSQILDGDLPTRVEDPAGQLARDPISELIELQGGKVSPTQQVRFDSEEGREDDTPLPAPFPAHAIPGSVTRSGPDILEGTGQRKRAVADAADAAIAALTAEEDDEPAASPRRASAQPQPEPDIEPMDMMLAERPRGRGLLWAGLTGVVLLGVFVYLWTQTDVFHPERAKRKREQARKEREAKIRAFNKTQPKPGKIEIGSEPEGAAIFWKLGRTPLESPQVRTGMIHQLRIEYDDHVPEDVNVSSKNWVGSGENMRAVVSVKLRRGDEKKAPAAPPKPSAALTAGPKNGKGVIQVKSTPSGAEVWVLIGFTGYFDGFDSQAGLPYEFKIQKDGFQPAYIVVRPEHWRIGGPDGKLRSLLVHDMKLVPVGK
jgi:serine/threonine protein kinase